MRLLQEMAFDDTTKGELKMYEIEVARGVAWLDKVAPGWHNKIDLNKFTLYTYRSCALGQIFGELASTNLCNDTDFSKLHGFWVPINPIMKTETGFFGKKTIVRNEEEIEKVKKTVYQILTSQWTQRILDRRASDRLQEEALNKVSKTNAEKEIK